MTARRSSRLAVPLLRPEDVIPHLGKPTHWKQGRSAKALADVWFHARDLPDAVRRVLDSAEGLQGAEFLEGWLERETDLNDGGAAPSQTDLLALLGVARDLVVLGIEAKVDESFGPLVSEWLSNGSDGKTRRLRILCDCLGLDPESIGHLRYQLLHRTAAVILEAQRFRTSMGVLIVHSFCARASGLADCVAFFDAIGLKDFSPAGLTEARRFAGVDLRAGWAVDAVPPRETVKPGWREDLAASVSPEFPVRVQPSLREEDRSGVLS